MRVPPAGATNDPTHLATARLLRMLGAVGALLFAAMALYLAPLDPGILSLQFAFDETTFKAILAQWGPAGVARFRAHFVADFAFLGCYGLFGYLLASRTAFLDGLPPLAKAAGAHALPVAAVADAVENVLQWHLSAVATPAPPPALYLAAGAASSLKWLLWVAFLSVIAVARVQNAR